MQFKVHRRGTAVYDVFTGIQNQTYCLRIQDDMREAHHANRSHGELKCMIEIILLCNIS